MHPGTTRTAGPDTSEAPIMRPAMTPTLARLALVAGIGTVLVAGCGGDSTSAAINVKPAFVGAITKTTYDGDDRRPADRRPRQDRPRAAPRPRSSIPTAPTAAELRKLAIYNNYRAIVDINANGGYGIALRPEHRLDGGNTLGEGKIAGTEYLAYADDGTGKKNVTMMVQVPTSFTRRPAVHRDRDVVRLARRLRRHRHRRRMGPEARLRRRLHRQGHRASACTTSRPTR